jgi:hypothetical protein
MPRHFAHSEDLMQEAVALVERVELRLPRSTDTVVAGFRHDGRFSLYIGDDPYYQFDPQGRLRRALVGNRMFRTQGSGLAALTRERKSETTELVRRDLDPAQFAQFLRVMLDEIGVLRQALASGNFQIVRQVPADTPILGCLVEALDAILNAAGELAPSINRMR